MIIALLGCVAAVLGIYGDLFASVVKRQCGIKDYGTIFPGHGGILDRFDSVMFIAPFVTMVITAVFYYKKGGTCDVEKNHAAGFYRFHRHPESGCDPVLRAMRCSAFPPTAMWIKFCSRSRSFIRVMSA